MEEKNRTLLVLAIAVTVLAAIFVSFGVPALTNQVPEVTLADISQPAETETERVLLPVIITPDTVQSVVASLVRPASYARTLKVALFWGDGQQASRQVRIWADEDTVKTVIGEGGGAQHRLVREGVVRLWYEGDRTWKELPAAANASDLAQKIPTYEDILNLDASQIRDAAYEVKNGKDCIYVETENPAWNTFDRYWIEAVSGLLTACETYENGKLVYQMEETAFSAPLKETDAFSLPDGTALP